MHHLFAVAAAYAFVQAYTEDTNGAGFFVNAVVYENTRDHNLFKSYREGPFLHLLFFLPPSLIPSFPPSLLVLLALLELMFLLSGGGWNYTLPVTPSQMYMVVLYAYEHEYNIVGNRVFDVLFNGVRLPSPLVPRCFDLIGALVISIASGGSEDRPHQTLWQAASHLAAHLLPHGRDQHACHLRQRIDLSRFPVNV